MELSEIIFELRYTYPEITRLELYQSRNNIILSLIVIKDKGKGIGSKVMKDLCNYADLSGLTISLTPCTSFGATSLSRLKGFYSRFGFKENKGRNKDYSISESMIRPNKIKLKKACI